MRLNWKLNLVSLLVACSVQIELMASAFQPLPIDLNTINVAEFHDWLGVSTDNDGSKQYWLMVPEELKDPQRAVHQAVTMYIKGIEAFLQSDAGTLHSDFINFTLQNSQRSDDNIINAQKIDRACFKKLSEHAKIYVRFLIPGRPVDKKYLKQVRILSEFNQQNVALPVSEKPKRKLQRRFKRD